MHSPKVLLLVFSLIALFGFSFQSAAQKIDKFSLCENVVKLNPIKPAEQFPKGARAYCWLRVSDAQPNSHIYMDWYWEGKLMHATKIDLPYASMRTYGYKTLTKNGRWKVAIRSADNEVLFEYPFRAGIGIDPAVPEPDNNAVNVIILNAKEIEENQASRNRIEDATPSTPEKSGVAPQQPVQAPAVRVQTAGQRVSQYVENPLLTRSRLLLPANYDPSVAYPLVIILPFEGGSSNNLYSSYLRDITQHIDDGQQSGPNQAYTELVNRVSPGKPFMLLLPAGVGQAVEGADFEKEVTRYEQRIFTDIERLKQSQRVGNIILAGYSLGADISWALLLRNPTYFNAALLMSSQFNYVLPDRLPILGQQQVRCYVYSGENEEDDRQIGIDWAKWQLEKLNVPHQFVVGQGLGRAALPPEALPSALQFLLLESPK